MAKTLPKRKVGRIFRPDDHVTQVSKDPPRFKVSGLDVERIPDTEIIAEWFGKGVTVSSRLGEDRRMAREFTVGGETIDGDAELAGARKYAAAVGKYRHRVTRWEGRKIKRRYTHSRKGRTPYYVVDGETVTDKREEAEIRQFLQERDATSARGRRASATAAGTPMTREELELRRRAGEPAAKRKAAKKKAAKAKPAAKKMPAEEVAAGIKEALPRLMEGEEVNTNAAKRVGALLVNHGHEVGALGLGEEEQTDLMIALTTDRDAFVDPENTQVDSGSQVKILDRVIEEIASSLDLE